MTVPAPTPPHDPNAGPYDVDLVLAIWTRIDRTLTTLVKLDLVDANALELRATLEHMRDTKRHLVTDSDLTIALVLLAAQDGMHAQDWLRMKAVEAAMPRRKAPAALDLQLRLRGLNARALALKTVTRGEGDAQRELARCTIVSTRGDIVSCESPDFAEALEAAMAMAGARRDPEPGGKR